MTTKSIVNQKLTAEEIDTFYKSVETLKKAEDVVFDKLQEVTSLGLRLVWANRNPTSLNNLIAALSPSNKRVALIFFHTFQPHVWGSSKADKRVKVFGKRDTTRTKETKQAAVKFFANDPKTGKPDPANGYYGGSYWLWSQNAVEIKEKDIDYLKLAIQAVKNAMDKGGIEQAEMIQKLNEVVFETEGDPMPEEEPEEAILETA